MEYMHVAVQKLKKDLKLEDKFDQSNLLTLKYWCDKIEIIDYYCFYWFVYIFYPFSIYLTCKYKSLNRNKQYIHSIRYISFELAV